LAFALGNEAALALGIEVLDETARVGRLGQES
jgi:hypothetical protein